MKLVLWPAATHHVQLAIEELVAGRSVSDVIVRGRVVRVFAGNIDPTAEVAVEFGVQVEEVGASTQSDGYSPEIVRTDLAKATHIEALLAGNPPHCKLAADCLLITRPSEKPLISDPPKPALGVIKELGGQLATSSLTINRRPSWLKQLTNWLKS